MVVKELDGNKCRVWGCGFPNNLEEHHIIPRGQGGSDDASNKITLCSFHHQQITDRKLSIIVVLTKLIHKVDFRWYDSLQWNIRRERLGK